MLPPLHRFLLVFAVPALLPWASPAAAQDTAVQYQDKPFAVIISRVTAEDGMAYLKSLSDRLHVGARTVNLISESQQDEARVLKRPVSGNLVFLQKALVPGVGTVDFEEVSSLEEFQKIVRGYYSENKDGGSTLEGSDDKFKLHRVYTGQRIAANLSSTESSDSESTADASETTDGEAAANDDDKPKHAISINLGTQGADVQYKSLADTDDVNFSFEDFRYYRYLGNLMYSGTDEVVWDMALPDRDGVLAEATEQVDYGAEVYLDRIPMGLKSMGWSMLFGTLSAEMQQRDGESDVDYNFRSASGRLALAIAKAGLFDTRHVSASMQFASVDRPIETRVAIKAAPGSDLSRRLADLSSGQSRFAPLLRDQSAVTLHFSARLPEESLDVLRTGGEFLKDQLIATAGADVDLVISGAEIAQTLGQIADQTNLELFAKLGWTQASGSVLYGGMSVGDNPELLQSVLTLLTPETAAQDIVDRFDIVQLGGRDVIRFQIPQDVFGEDAPFRLTHLYITHANSCLWCCAGGESAWQILEQSIAACEAAGLRTSTRVFTASLDLQQWLSYPSDDPTGLAMLPRVMDRLMTQSLEDNISGEAQQNLLQRVIDLGGRTDIQVAFDTSETGLRLESEIGQTFGSYVVAQYLQLFDGLGLDELAEPEDTADQADSSTPTDATP